MGLISKPYTFTDGDTIEAAEHNSNFDTVYAAVNGGLDQDNLSGSTQIPNAYLVEIAPTKVGDHAASDAAFKTATTPGTTASLQKPTTLSGELERLRYRIWANSSLLNAYYMDSSGTPAASSWVEPRVFWGRQFLPNNGFEVKTSGTATDAPDGWSLYGTPTDLTVTSHASSGDAFGTEKRFLHITGDSGEGIQYVVSGVKPSTKYLIGMAYVRTAGTVSMSTTGALGSGDYQNLSLSSATGTTASYLNGIVSSDSSGSDITVRFHCGDSSTEYALYQVWMFELSDTNTFDIPHIPVRTVEVSTQATTPATFTSGQWNWETQTGLSISQYIPHLGYRATYEVTLSYRALGSANDVHKHAFRIQVDGSTVAGPYIEYTDADGAANFEVGDIITLRYVVDNLAPGATYAFTFDVGAWNDAGGDNSQVVVNPLVDGLQSVSTARLIVERI